MKQNKTKTLLNFLTKIKNYDDRNKSSVLKIITSPYKLNKASETQLVLYVAILFYAINPVIYIAGGQSIKSESLFFVKIKNLLSQSLINHLRSRVEDYYGTSLSIDDLMQKNRDVFCGRAKFLFYRTNRLSVVGSPLSLLQHPFSYLIPLLNDIKLTGVVHGACYHEIKENEIENFESRLSDCYYGWGFSRSSNVIPQRFGAINKSNSSSAMHDKLRIIIPLKNDSNAEVVEFMFESKLMGLYNEYNERISEVCSIFSFFCIEFFVRKHPKSNLLLDQSVRYSDIIKENDVFLLIAPCQTILFKVLVEGYGFVYFIDKRWLGFVSERFRGFLHELRLSGFVYYNDERDKFIKYIAEIDQYDIRKSITIGRKYLWNV